jgi:hypothetical protein
MRVAEFRSFQEGDLGSAPTGKRVSVFGTDIILYWLLRISVRERGSLVFHCSPLFRGQGDLSHRALQGNRSHGPEKTGLYGQQTFRGGTRLRIWALASVVLLQAAQR